MTQPIPTYEERRWKAAAERWPFRDDALMEGPPSCTLRDLRRPRLRRCPFDPDTITWLSRLGGGLDGYCWKVNFGDQGPFVLKLFWDRARVTMAGFAAQKECRNAALLQMMATAVEDGKASGTPVLLNIRTADWTDAMENVESFSVEARQNAEGNLKQAAEMNIELRPVLSVPRLRRCFGWLPLPAEFLKAIPRPLRVPAVRLDHKRTRWLDYSDDPETPYTGIVYEYIEAGPNDPAVVQEVLDFLHLAGFVNASGPRGCNWESSVLLDLSDIVNPLQRSWSSVWHKRGMTATQGSGVQSAFMLRD
ncbi:hypothetical protein SPI_03519 [Niveomyces insectorum RCEF 264]|uniref:Protein kinase-like domain protein n=1 Tax=Niveomyces insectorum RCEF 264 TaxID=1081102 RepID=A0A167W598_9HYPO|nr:hypothetical protein SPI_03519 [Niveomyces insectorum RCEF 264]